MRKRWLSNVDFPRKVFFKKDLIKHIESVHAKKSTSNVNIVTRGNLKKTLEILKSHSDIGFKIA